MKAKHNQLVISLLLLNASHNDALQALKASNKSREYVDFAESMGEGTMDWAEFQEVEDQQNLQAEMAEEGSLRLESLRDLPHTAEFIKSRNQLNQEEAVHSEMYDTLIDKLTDTSFIFETIHPKSQKPQFLNQMGVADDKKNFQRGSSTLCAEEGGSCQCSGSVIYSAPRADKSVVADDLRKESHAIKDDVEAHVECTSEAFGKDPAKGVKKQCVCVKDYLPDTPAAALCAKDGATCNCSGNVYYGASKDGKFESIFKQKNATYGLKGASGGSIKCSADVFGDPAPKSKDKSCFCQKAVPFKPEKDMIVENCAKENQKCSCLGTVHFGVVEGKSTFSSAFVSRDLRKTAPEKGSINCSSAEFGDPAVGKAKQCLCERPKPPAPLPTKVRKCGEEGELCKCNGQVYMGRLHGNELEKGISVEDILEADKKKKAREDKKAARKKAQEKKETKAKKQPVEAEKAPKKAKAPEKDGAKPAEPEAPPKKPAKNEYVPKPGEGYDAAGADPLRADPSKATGSKAKNANKEDKKQKEDDKKEDKQATEKKSEVEQQTEKVKKEETKEADAKAKKEINDEKVKEGEIKPATKKDKKKKSKSSTQEATDELQKEEDEEQEEEAAEEKEIGDAEAKAKRKDANDKAEKKQKTKDAKVKKELKKDAEEKNKEKAKADEEKKELKKKLEKGAPADKENEKGGKDAKAKKNKEAPKKTATKVKRAAGKEEAKEVESAPSGQPAPAAKTSGAAPLPEPLLKHEALPEPLPLPDSDPRKEKVQEGSKSAKAPAAGAKEPKEAAKSEQATKKEPAEEEDADEKADVESQESSPAASAEVEEEEEDGDEVEDEEELLLSDDDEEATKEEEQFSRKEIGFDDMMKYGFAQKEAFGSINCSSAEFGDPASGEAKQCFCESETPEPEIERCALESDKTECVCIGKVYYGQLEVGDETLASFDLMKAQKKYKVLDSKGSIGCSDADFGGDPAPGLKKQCFCEKGAKPEVRRCGLDDDDCQCKGNIFYGALELGKKKPIAFKDMLEEEFQYKESDGKKPVKCAPASFEKDPLPGKPKQCYCDDIEEMSKDEIKNALDLLEAKAEAEKAQEEARQLEAEKEKKQKEEAERIKKLEEKKREVEAQIAKEKAEAARLAKIKQDKYNAEALKERKEEEAAQLKLDDAEHDKELAAAGAAQEAKLAKQKAERAKKAAAMAKQADKLKLQLEAQKLEAEQAKKEEAAKAAEAEKKVAQHRAALHKQKEAAAVEAEKASAKVDAALKAQEVKAKEAAMLAKLEVERKVVEDEKIRAEMEAARQEAAVEAAIEKALAEQTRIYKLKAEEEAKQLQIKAEKQRIKDEEARRLAAIEAEKQAKIEAQKRKILEEKRRALEEEEKKRKAEEKARKAAEEALKKEQEEIARKAQEERDAVLKAQREEALAKTAGEIQAAKDKTAGLAAKLKDILKEKEEIEDKKRELALEKEREIAAGKAAKAEAKQAEKDLKKARELAQKKKRQAQQLKEKLAKDEAAAAEHLKELVAAAEKKLKENQAREAEAKAARERLHRMELEAMQKEREAKMQARKEKDEAMAKAHQAKLLARKEAFENTFRNVWGISPQGVAQVQMTLKDKEQAEDLKNLLFAETIIADVHQNNETVSRTFKNETLLHVPFKGLLHVDKGFQRLHMITTDDRVAELVEMTYKVTKDAKTPLLVTTLHGASENYIKWVQKQCEPNDDDHFSNQDPFDTSKPIAKEAISKMEDHEKKEKVDAAKSNGDLDREALEKSKEEDKAKEEEKQDEEERQLKENQSKSDAEKEKAAKEAEEKEADEKVKENAEKKGIFKTKEEAEAALEKQSLAEAEAEPSEKEEATEDLQLYDDDLYDRIDR